MLNSIRILLRNFASVYSRILACSFPVFWSPLVGFIKQIWEGSFLLCGSLRNTDVRSYLKVCCNSAVNPSAPRLFLGCNFKLCFSISLLFVDLFRFCIPSWLSLGGLFLSRNLSVSSRCSKFWSINFRNNLLSTSDF